MKSFVLDASVAFSWCFPGDVTEDTPYSRTILRELLISDAIVPDVWAFEIANNIYVACNRRKRMSEKQAAEYLILLKSLPISSESRALWLNLTLESTARLWDIAAYDAAYLELALRKNLPLATSDKLLKQKAIAAGVAILG